MPNGRRVPRPWQAPEALADVLPVLEVLDVVARLQTSYPTNTVLADLATQLLAELSRIGAARP